LREGRATREIKGSTIQQSIINEGFAAMSLNLWRFRRTISVRQLATCNLLRACQRVLTTGYVKEARTRGCADAAASFGSPHRGRLRAIAGSDNRTSMCKSIRKSIRSVSVVVASSDVVHLGVVLAHASFIRHLCSVSQEEIRLHSARVRLHDGATGIVGGWVSTVESSRYESECMDLVRSLHLEPTHPFAYAISIDHSVVGTHEGWPGSLALARGWVELAPVRSGHTLTP
jgi:hypothetical protein